MIRKTRVEKIQLEMVAPGEAVNKLIRLRKKLPAPRRAKVGNAFPKGSKIFCTLRDAMIDFPGSRAFRDTSFFFASLCHRTRGSLKSI
jgi:hypothetical protein